MQLQPTPGKCASGSERIPLYSYGAREVHTVKFETPLIQAFGPTTQYERLRWPHECWMRFPPAMEDRLIRNYKRMQWKDYLGGLNGRGQCTYQAKVEINAHLDADGKLPDVSETFCVTEIGEFRLGVLQNIALQCRAKHHHADFWERLGEEAMKSIEDHVAPWQKSGKKSCTLMANKYANLGTQQHIRNM